ncbi:MAG TPA: 2-amino-4-hydroxy-6-hydroxymethyldihydropteridine diphosphokinase [Candidatus Corynebacterium avicola]|uniref:2-amino-4-hydroxy-6-hydroxymethyldihydropteridine diphosphokinase n=1 Tax=Candidatus Corynebacterium avicola TaxID=2838527 RepID=A0A9D1RPZ1_9CORY|nr:2-amino-4-hydroxy-6-hydroxymethyldihydropteridine diphosphokinase [Candidatus Corynebacterium avicola]
MNPTRRAVVAFGSNLAGPLSGPEEQIRVAAAALADRDGVAPVAASAMYATAPWGVTDQDEFRNSVLVVDTTLSPLELLHLGQSLEQEARRVRERHWGPRTLDIDLVHIEGEASDTDELRLPHPWAHERAFVLVPWLDADPDAVLSGRPVADWLAELGSEAATEGIRPLPEVEWSP